MKSHLRFVCAVTSIAAAIALGACTRNGPEYELEAARVALDKGALPEALVHLKTALQHDAASMGARYLLGKALLQSGQPALAELELRKATEGGYKAPDLQPLLAQALYESGKHKKLVAEFGKVATGDQTADRMVLVWVANAHFALGEMEATQSVLAKLLAEAPDLTPARLLKVRALVAQGDVEGAFTEVNDVLRREPKSTDVITLAADLHVLGRRDLPGGLKLYERALDLDPRDVRAATGAFQIRLQQRDLPGAAKIIAQIKKTSPASPQTRFLEAQYLFANNDLKAAREGGQQLLKLAPENVSVIQFAAMVELQSGAARQAESLFGKLLQKFPDSPSVRTMLAEAQFKGGNGEKAQQTLQPLLNATVPPKEALILSAEIALQDGDARRAEALFKRARDVEPDDVKVRTAMALIELSRGNGGNGLRELQAIADQQKLSTSADMVLISALMSRGDLDGALKAVDVLAQKAPDSPMVDMFRGRILLAKNDRAGARKAFERIASTRPHHFASMVSLALMDVGEGRVEAAQARYEAFLKSGASPQAISLTYRSMAGLRQAAGASRSEVIKDLRLAVKSDPANVPAWQMLIDELLAARDSKAAVVVAQEALAANPEEGRILDGLGRAQMYAGDLNQAAATFSRFVRAQPRNPLAHARLGQAQFVGKNEKVALASFGRALEIDPANDEASKGILAIGKRQRDQSELIALARDLQKRQPQSASGFLLEGELLMDRGEFAAAIGPFRSALGKRGEGRAAARVHTALVAAGRQADAVRYEAERLAARPDDVVLRQYLADRALVAKDYARAEGFYQDVVKLAPADAKAANNLAWLMIQIKKPGAIAYAQRASALSAGNPAVLDTLVSAYAAEGQGKLAVETARQALARQPDNASLQLSLAKTMGGMGETKFAAELFASIEKGSGSAELKSEARRLAATL